MKRIRLNSWVRKAFQGGSQGFTLIEVVIAIALIGLIGAAVLSALSTASLALIIADERATAESVARTQMEYVKDNNSNPYDSEDPQSYEHNPVESGEHPGYFISVSAEPLHNPDDGIQEITVIVTYYTVRGDNGMREQKYILVDYKRNPEV
jgi:prepilin-type N-terminal cleavage/methylation domain-containing protein